MFGGIYSIYLAQESNNIANRFSAYELLSNEKPAPVAYSKTISTLVSIEPIENLVYSIPTLGLSLESCDYWMELLRFCSKNRLDSSTYGNDVSFNNISNGILTTQVTNDSTVTIKQADSSLLWFKSYSSKIELNKISNNIVHIEGARNSVVAKYIENSTLSFLSDSDYPRLSFTPSRFRYWYENRLLPQNINPDGLFYESLLHELQTTDRESLNSLISKPEDRVEIIGVPSTDFNKLYFRRDDFGNTPLFNPTNTDQIYMSGALTFEDKFCVVKEERYTGTPCFTESSEFFSANIIQVFDIKSARILLNNANKVRLSRVRDLHLSIARQGLGLPIYIDDYSGSLLIDGRWSYLGGHQSKGEFNIGNEEELYKKLHDGFPHIPSFPPQVGKIMLENHKNKIKESKFTEKDYNRLRSSSSGAINNINIYLTNDRFNKGSEVVFDAAVIDSIIYSSSSNLKFNNKVLNSIVLLDSNQEIYADSMENTIVVMFGKDDSACKAAQRIRTKTVYLVGEKCEGFENISSENFLAFLASYYGNNISSNEIAYIKLMRELSFGKLKIAKDKANLLNDGRIVKQKNISFKNLDKLVIMDLNSDIN